MSLRAGIPFFMASIAINSAMLYSVDHAATLRYQKNRIAALETIAKKSSGPIAFEYVESPKVHVRKPLKKSSRISDHDAVNQDLTRDKSSATGAPQAAMLGHAEQLTQRRGEPSPPAMRAPVEMRPDAGYPMKDEPVVKENSQKSKTSQTIPPARQSTATDRIMVSEISRAKSHGVQLYGTISFEATGSGMGVYMKNLKERIWLAWFPYLTVHYPKDFKTADAVVSFTLDAKGDIKVAELLENKGSALFAAFCLESVKKAAPFGPLPQEILDLLGKDELEIRFAFHYW